PTVICSTRLASTSEGENRLFERVRGWMLDRLGAKRAYDLRRIGVEGRPVPPPSSPHILLDWYRRHELVYACISKIADAAIDPEPFVERRVEKNTWERIDGHPLERLLVRPNPLQDGPSFIGS